jgi:hypothetical protein
MTLDGRVNVDVLFHDVNGTSSIKVVTLNNSQEFSGGKVAVITGTAGSSYTNIGTLSQTTYRNAAGEAVLMDSVDRIIFMWSEEYPRTLGSFGEQTNFALVSAGGIPAMTWYPSEIPGGVELGGGVGTGTYKIILCERFNP